MLNLLHLKSEVIAIFLNISDTKENQSQQQKTLKGKKNQVKFALNQTQCFRMCVLYYLTSDFPEPVFKLPHNCTNITCQQGNAQNPSS